jgi:hypothetical protein
LGDALKKEGQNAPNYPKNQASIMAKQTKDSPADFLQLNGDYGIIPVVSNPKVRATTSAPSPSPSGDDVAGAIVTVLITLLLGFVGLTYFAGQINTAWIEGKQAKANAQGEAAIAKVEELKQEICK